MSDYRVQFEVFEGPLDLLLYLIKKEEVDIYEVNLTKLAAQFIEYVELLRQFDLDVAGEFLVMASTLMYLKSRELLPEDQQVAVEGEEEEGEDPRFELIRQLVEYKKFKDAAAQMQALEERREHVYPRQPAKVEFVAENLPVKPEVGIFDLLNAVNGILRRFADKVAATREIYEDKWTVSEKIEFIRGIISERETVKFSELFENAANRAEVVCTFLALLELIRLKQLGCDQAEPFAEIRIGKAMPVVVPAGEENHQSGVSPVPQMDLPSLSSDALPPNSTAPASVVPADRDGEATATESEGLDAGKQAEPDVVQDTPPIERGDNQFTS